MSTRVRDDSAPPRPDLRLLVPAGACWLGAASVGLLAPHRQLVLAAALLVGSVPLWRGCVGGARRRVPGGPRRSVVAVAALVACAAGLTASGVRAVARASGPLLPLARVGADVVLRLELSGDPVVRDGVAAGGRRYHLVIVPAQLVRLETDDGRAWLLRQPLLVLATDDGWAGLLPSQTVTAAGILGPPRAGDDVAAVLEARGPPEQVGPASPVQQAAGAVRGDLRGATRGLPGQAAALLPALVDGDTAALTTATTADFRATGLTHLVAVSGENLAVVTGVVLATVRRLRVGPRWAALLTALAIGGFVVLARPSPSVLRAAVMGGVTLASLATGHRRPALGGLATAVLVLLLADPSLARQPGFTLSVLASLGLLVLAPGMTERLATRMPRPLAAALAVPTAAQLACTPVIAGIGGGLGLLAVPANLLAAPAVAPATVLGVLAAVGSPLLPVAGRLLAAAAWLPCGWLVLVAHVGARVPFATVPIPAGVPGAVLSVALSVSAGVLLMVAFGVVRRRRREILRG